MKKKQLIYVIIAIVVIGIPLYLSVSKTNQMNRTAVFETNQGTFKIEMYEDKAPMTTKNFIDLAQNGFYNGTRFHRVIDKFMIQGGDPLSKDITKQGRWGTGGPGFSIDDEFGAGLSNIKGTISMANSGPNTGGSQFFINVASNTFLDGKHPVFGKVIEGYDIVEKISKIKTNSEDRPVDDIIINKVTITSK